MAGLVYESVWRGADPSVRVQANTRSGGGASREGMGEGEREGRFEREN